MSDYNIKGISQLQGTPVSGSRVRLHNQDLDVYKGDLITNSSGSFRFDLTESESFSSATTELVGLDFDGTDDYVQVPFISDYGTPQFSVSVLFKLNSYSSVHQSITSNRSINSSAGWTFYILPDNRLEIWFGTTADTWARLTDFTPTLGQYYYLTVTHNGSTARLYVDGVENGSMSLSNYNTPSDNIRIGSGNNNSVSPSFYLDGVVSETSIWNYALTQQQIQDNMSTTLCGNETGLVGYWRLNEILSGEVVDLSSNTNNGTVNSAPTLVNTGEIVTECGVTASAYNFHVLCEYTDINGNYQTQSLPYINAVQKVPYTITFTVTDNVTGNPIEGATITIASQTITTNINGVATIDLVNETYSYLIEASGYEDITGSVTVDDSDISVNEPLTEFTGTVVSGGTATTSGNYTYRTLTNGQVLEITGADINMDYILVGNGSGGSSGSGFSGGGTGGSGGRVLMSSGTFSNGTYNVSIGGTTSLGSLDNSSGTTTTGGSGTNTLGLDAGSGEAGPIWINGQRFGGAGGGGGVTDGNNDCCGGSGGAGGGGNGSSVDTQPGQAGANTFGGGGGGGLGGGGYSTAGGAGGTGIVKVRYLTSDVE